MVLTRPTTGYQVQPLDKGLALIAEPGLRPEILLLALALEPRFKIRLRGTLSPRKPVPERTLAMFLGT